MSRKKAAPELTDEERAALAYNTLDLLGREMIGALLIFMYFSEEIIAKVPWLQAERKKVGPGPFAGAHQIALAAVASVMTRYCEVYKRYLSRLKIPWPDAKELLKDAGLFDELRQVTQHIDDNCTGLTNTATRMILALQKLDPIRPLIMTKEGIASLGTRVIAVRDAVTDKFPNSKKGRDAYLSDADKAFEGRLSPELKAMYER